MSKFYVDLANNIYHILSNGFNSNSGIIANEYNLESAFAEINKIGTPAIFLIKTSDKSTGLTVMASASDADDLVLLDPDEVGIKDQSSHLAYCMYKANCSNIISKLAAISSKFLAKGQTDLSEHLDKIISISKNSNSYLDKKSQAKENELTKIAKMQEIKNHGFRKI